MIIWSNCKISDVRPNPQPRFHLRDENRVDIAKYSFASFAPLEPLVSQFIFNLEFADGHAGQEKEMEDWLRGIFPANKLVLNWFRCNNISQWKEFQKSISHIDDPIIFPTGNEDHVFVDSNITMMGHIIDALKNQMNFNASTLACSWPETIRASFGYNGIKQGSVIRYQLPTHDSMRILKREFFDWYLEQNIDENFLFFRYENLCRAMSMPVNIMYAPTKEQFRHYDGYMHVGIGPERVPPIEIPPGFFNKELVIKYGFDERDNSCVNINPKSPTLYAQDGTGTDYRWTLEDIPAFWKPYIKDIIVAPNIDEIEMKKARNENMIACSRLQIHWPHFNMVFNDQSGYPPIDWLKEHFLSY